MDVLIGVKVGMSRLFEETGRSVPVTVLDMSGNRIAQIKQSDTDGYAAVQIAHGEVRKKRLSNAQIGHRAKHKVGLAYRIREARIADDQVVDYESGTVLNMNPFSPGVLVNVSAVSKGRGFTGAIKRHNFRSGRATHGNSRAHNKPGSSGQCQDPGRVFKGKKMAGQMGNKKITLRNLRIAHVDEERKLLFVTGGVPGAANSEVFVKIAPPHCQPQQVEEGNS